MPQIDVPLIRGRFGETSRPDNWWVQPAVVAFGFLSFIVYSTWAAMQGNNYSFGPLISPMYSPLLYGDTRFAWFGAGPPSWFPSFLPFSAAMLILWAPGGFRFTCYYYRGAYYKAFWQDPPNCAVGEPRKKYWGERTLPLVLQNIHRYFLYLVLLSSYTLGCHSFRHLVGGMKDVLSRSPMRKKAYDCVSCLNARHMRFAWFSLVFVGFSDLYVRMCAMGIWTDYRSF